MKTLLMTLVVTLLSNMVFSADHKELKAYPPAKDGMERLVIVLPHKERGEDQSFKVELIPGKQMLTDGVNKMRLGISLDTKTVKGWGYSYYEVKGKAVAMSTLIAPPPGAKKVKKFVGGTPLIIRYNSRLPVVIYVPKGVEIRYRIWEAPQDFKKVDKG